MKGVRYNKSLTHGRRDFLRKVFAVALLVGLVALFWIIAAYHGPVVPMQ